MKENAILISPPDADFVLIVSASPWLWSAFGVFVLGCLLCLGAFARNKKD